MASAFMRRRIHEADDRIRDQEQTVRSVANKLRGHALWLRRLGDDAVARELEGMATRLKGAAAEMLTVRRDLVAALADDGLEDTIVGAE